MHYVYINDCNRFMCNKTKCKNKKRFCRFYLQCFSRKNVLTEQKKVCLKINGKKKVKLKSGSMKFKNCHKQLTISFKIYADFEHNVKNINVNISDKYSDICDNLHTPKNIKIRILSVLLLKLFVLVINLSNQLFLREEKMKFINLLMKFFKKV